MFDDQILKLILGIILLLVLVIGVVAIPSVGAVVGKLTIKGESSTIYFNESVYYKGKLTDSEGYAISFERINIWENVNGEWQYITQGKTSARGEYKITIPANHWNYAKTVNILANSASSIQSTSLSLNIEKPYSYQVKQQNNNYIQSSAINHNVDTNIVLKVRGDKINNSVELNPILTTSNGNELYSDDIKIYVNEEFLGTIPANKWSNSLSFKSGFYSFTAKYEGVIIYETIYNPSSGKANYDLNGSTTSSNIVKNPTAINNDDQYKDPSYKIKSKYYDALQELKAGIKLSESSLSGISFESSDAKKKLDSAWEIRYMVWEYIGEGEDILNDAESYLIDHNYQKAWEKLHQFDIQLYKAYSHISAISTEIKEGKELEDKFQDKNKTCFLVWCNAKDTTKGLDVKIKDLKLKVEKIKNKQKDIKLLYQIGVQNHNFVEQEKLLIEKEIEQISAQTKQNNLESEKRQTEIFAAEKQQRLEEQRQREQRQYEEELRQQEQIRLQEQRQYEEELRQQRLQAEQERKRLEEQRQRELAEQRRQAEEEHQRLEAEQMLVKLQNQVRLQSKHSPLLKGIINNDELTFSVVKLPSYVSQNVRNEVERLSSWMDGKYINGVKLKRVNSYGDFSVNWVKDYQEEAIGRQVGSHLIVGLGTGNCYGDWMPFDAQTVYRIMWHEVGHAMGQDHNSDFNNIMYEHGTGNKFEYDYSERIVVSDGWYKPIQFCRTGAVYFTTERVSSDDGYKVYVIPSNTNVLDVINGKSAFYTTCSVYENSVSRFNQSCDVAQGSKLVLYNPSRFNAGDDIMVDIKIFDRNPMKENMDMVFDKDSRYWTQEQLNDMRKLFR